MLQSRVQTAVDYYLKSGYNCSQAIAVAYSELLGLDPMVCFKGMEACGTGMGGRMGTCGAISGAVYLIGFIKSTGNMDDDRTNKSKAVSCGVSGELTKAFFEKNKTITCCDMKTPGSDKFRACPNCIADAAILVEEMLFPGQFEKSTYYEDKEKNKVKGGQQA